MKLLCQQIDTNKNKNGGFTKSDITLGANLSVTLSVSEESILYVLLGYLLNQGFLYGLLTVFIVTEGLINNKDIYR